MDYHLHQFTIPDPDSGEEVIEDPDRENHDRYLKWAGWNFDPDAFNPQQVRFTDLEERYQFAYG